MDAGSSVNQQFTNTLARLQGRTLIVSRCKRCGLSKLVSVSDGSLEEWHQRHRCIKRDYRQSAENERGLN